VRVDVRSGQRRRLREPSDDVQAYDLELTASVIVVWIRVSGTSATQVRFEIARWDGSSTTVLDSGPVGDVRGDSLAVSGGRAFWFARGQPQSAVVG